MSDWHIWGESLAVDRVYALVSGLRLEERKDRAIMVLQAYFDESLKGTTFVIAGFVASAEKWGNLSQGWESLLKEKKLNAFKWFKMQKRVNDNELFYREIEKHVDYCIYSITDIADLHKAIDDFQWPQDVFLDLEELKRRIRNPYHMGVKHILVNLTEQKESLGLSGPIDIIFDDKTEKHTVIGAYDYLKFSSTKEFKERLGGLSFMDDEKMLPLQSADLYAGWIRKSHIEGKNLKSGHPFPWPMNKPMHTLYMYLKYDFFMEEFEALCGIENLETFVKYVKELKA